MKNAQNVGSLLVTFILTFTASAEILRCESENVKIEGPIHVKYLRMGHSVFNGLLNVVTSETGEIKTSSKLSVSLGDIQDDSWISTVSAEDQIGQSASFRIVPGESSFIQIGHSLVSFVPDCVISADAAMKPTCASNSSLGRSCHLAQGGCVCSTHIIH